MSKRYRFVTGDFMNRDMSPSTVSLSRYGLEEYQAERIASIANKILEQWEAESEKVYGEEVIEGAFGIWSQRKDYDESGNLLDTHQAFLWRPEVIK